MTRYVLWIFCFFVAVMFASSVFSAELSCLPNTDFIYFADLLKGEIEVVNDYVVKLHVEYEDGPMTHVYDVVGSLLCFKETIKPE